MHDRIDLDKHHPFVAFLNQIGLLIDDDEVFFPALMTALALPDICSALQSPNGVTNGPGYAAWFDRWVAPKYAINGVNSLSGAECYKVRCAALHQARLMHSALSKRLVFMKPGALPVTLHNVRNGDVLYLDTKVFCTDVVQSAHDWFLTVEQSQPFESNYADSMQIRHGGFGISFNVPVIA